MAAKLPHNPSQRLRLRVDVCPVTRCGGEIGLKGIELTVMIGGMLQGRNSDRTDRSARQLRREGGVTLGTLYYLTAM